MSIFMSIQESNIKEDTACNLKVSLLRGGREERVTSMLEIKTQVWSNVSIKKMFSFSVKFLEEPKSR